jgi:hypothetical protein
MRSRPILTLTLTLVIAAVTTVLALGTVVPANAQDATDQDATDHDAQRETDTDLHAERATRRTAHLTAFTEALAAELGLEADEVADAIAAVRDDLVAERQAARHEALQARLDAAVDAGDLTREQADALLAAQEAGVFRGALGGQGVGRGPGGR